MATAEGARRGAGARGAAAHVLGAEHHSLTSISSVGSSGSVELQSAGRYRKDAQLLRAQETAHSRRRNLAFAQMAATRRAATRSLLMRCEARHHALVVPLTLSIDLEHAALSCQCSH